MFLSFFTRGGYNFKFLNYNRELIPNCWRSYRKSRFVNIELSFMNKMLFGKGWPTSNTALSYTNET